jgi:hypothetical protein
MSTCQQIAAVVLGVVVAADSILAVYAIGRRIALFREDKAASKPEKEQVMSGKVTICECGLAKCYHEGSNALAYREPHPCRGYTPRAEGWWKCKPAPKPECGSKS